MIPRAIHWSALLLASLRSARSERRAGEVNAVTANVDFILAGRLNAGTKLMVKDVLPSPNSFFL